MGSRAFVARCRKCLWRKAARLLLKKLKRKANGFPGIDHKSTSVKCAVRRFLLFQEKTVHLLTKQTVPQRIMSINTAVLANWLVAGHRLIPRYKLQSLGPEEVVTPVTPGLSIFSAFSALCRKGPISCSPSTASDASVAGAAGVGCAGCAGVDGGWGTGWEADADGSFTGWEAVLVSFETSRWNVSVSGRDQPCLFNSSSFAGPAPWLAVVSNSIDTFYFRTAILTSAAKLCPPVLSTTCRTPQRVAIIQDAENDGIPKPNG